MNMERRGILLIVPIALGLANWLPNQVAAADFGEAQVTQVVQDVKVVPSGAIGIGAPSALTSAFIGSCT